MKLTTHEHATKWVTHTTTREVSTVQALIGKPFDEVTIDRHDVENLLKLNDEQRSAWLDGLHGRFYSGRAEI